MLTLFHKILFDLLIELDCIDYTWNTACDLVKSSTAALVFQDALMWTAGFA
jgi:hypothetical protein